jgi:hypothetical protein
MIHDTGRLLRLIALGATAVALLAVTGGGTVLAGSNGVKAAESVATTAPTDPTASPVAASAALIAATSAPTGDQSNPFVAAVEALVADATINQQQADVLRQSIEAGSMNPQDLIDRGVLTAAQMEVVNARLTALKRSLATAPDANKEAGASGATKRVESEAARADEAVALAAFHAAIQALVADGTIDQAQADILRRGVDAGSINPQDLIDNGTFTAAEMKAAQTRLSAVKESLAPKNGESGTSPGSKDVQKTK